jgi:hypothetical protein
MKKLRNLIAAMAVASIATVLTGCGDEGGDDNGGGNPQPANFSPATEGDLTAANKTYTVNVAGQADPITLTFPSAGNYQMVQAGVTEIGTFSGAAKTGESWQLNISPAAGQQGAQEGVLRLDWTGANTGTWTFTPTGGAPESGTFTVTQIDPGPGPGPGNTNTNNPPVGGLVGKTLQVNYAGGGGDKFQFTSDTAVSWENGTSTGTYTSNAANDNIDVVLADGQLFDITLSGGTSATVIYQANGGAEQQTFTGNYTLQ